MSSGIKATFLMTIRRRDKQFNIGAAVDHRGQVWLISPPEGKPVALSQNEAIAYQTKIGKAVLFAALHHD